MGQKLEEQARHISAALAFEQPRLQVSLTKSGLLVSGEFDLKPRKSELASLGKLDQFTIMIEVPRSFPKGEPKLFETSGRIPHEADRHINPDGSCCFGVWEAWCASAERVNFQEFLDGPVRNFFFGQYYYEKYNSWPYGEYEHGKDGLLQSYAEVMSCRPKVEEINYRLRMFSKPWPKGHWNCVCGSGEKIRHCCKEIHLKPPVSTKSAIQMRKRFEEYFDV